MNKKLFSRLEHSLIWSFPTSCFFQDKILKVKIVEGGITANLAFFLVFNNTCFSLECDISQKVTLKKKCGDRKLHQN